MKVKNMARRSTDTYTTIEESVVKEVSEILGELFALKIATPLTMDADHWREVCQNCPRVAHLTAGRNGFKLDAGGVNYVRKPNLPLGHAPLELDPDEIAGPVSAVMNALDPKGILQVFEVRP